MFYPCTHFIYKQENKFTNKDFAKKSEDTLRKLRSDLGLNTNQIKLKIQLEFQHKFLLHTNYYQNRNVGNNDNNNNNNNNNNNMEVDENVKKLPKAPEDSKVFVYFTKEIAHIFDDMCTEQSDKIFTTKQLDSSTWWAEVREDYVSKLRTQLLNEAMYWIIKNKAKINQMLVADQDPSKDSLWKDSPLFGKLN